jgi:hypothetical protein
MPQEPSAPRSADSAPLWTRRHLLAVGAAGAVAFAAGPLLPPAPAHGATLPVAKLPGEVSRHVGLVSRYGGTEFDSVRVSIAGDRARLFIPRGMQPYQTAAVPVLWLIHGAESSDDALLGGFRGIGERAVDKGFIAICQNLGGTLYSHPTAKQHFRNGHAYLSALFPVSGSVIRGTSHGGCLAVEALAANVIPGIRGIYIVNGVYDVVDLYKRGSLQARISVGSAFGYNGALIAANNPARHTGAAYAGKSLRAVYSTPDSSDTTTPPPVHAKKLIAVAKPTALEASARTHTLGHTTPGFADIDNVDAMMRWTA